MSILVTFSKGFKQGNESPVKNIERQEGKVFLQIQHN
jgi:hypothetical protein